MALIIVSLLMFYRIKLGERQDKSLLISMGFCSFLASTVFYPVSQHDYSRKYLNKNPILFHFQSVNGGSNILNNIVEALNEIKARLIKPGEILDLAQYLKYMNYLSEKTSKLDIS